MSRRDRQGKPCTLQFEIANDLKGPGDLLLEKQPIMRRMKTIGVADARSCAKPRSGPRAGVWASAILPEIK